MPEPQFPLYRRSANGLNWYRIESATEFTEVQSVGSRYVAHLIKALTYPEKVRIMELIAIEDGGATTCRGDEFDLILRLAGSPNGAATGGGDPT